MNETLPIRWIGYPVYPSDPPEDFDRDPCTWYWYKDPADIPERHFARHGLGAEAVTTPAPEPPAAAAVGELLAEAGEEPHGELELSPIEGGASRQTFLVVAGGEPRYVVRREPAAGMSFASLEARAACDRRRRRRRGAGRARR